MKFMTCHVAAHVCTKKIDGYTWDDKHIHAVGEIDLMNAVYRQCADPECPAWWTELPHSHLEEATNTELEAFKAKWNALHDRATQATYVPATLESAPVTAWMSIPLDGPGMDDIMQKVGEYITWVETGMTRDVCKCQWILHPEKGNIRGGDTALDCPAHSKEGLVLGFFAWLRAQPHGLLPDTAMGDNSHGN